MPRHMTRALITGMLLTLGGAIVYVLMSASAGPAPQTTYEKFAQGPLEGLDFAYAGEQIEGAEFIAPDGTLTSMPALRGKVLLVNLWATWCGPCEREMPTLAALQTARGGDKFDVIAISVDAEEDRDHARSELERWSGNQLQLYHAPDFKITYDIGARGFPTSILYNGNGIEIARYSGELDWASFEAVAFIDAVIAADS
ncbi:MAG: redoxin family protein [Hyphomonadaceae bacterium]